jgi:hypothetical protein
VRDRGGEEDKDEREPKPVPRFAEAHTAFQTVKLFFSVYNIGERDENILNMERLKHLQNKFFLGGKNN